MVLYGISSQFWFIFPLFASCGELVVGTFHHNQVGEKRILLKFVSEI